MDVKLTKREQQVLDAITDDWLDADQIVSRIVGKKIFKQHVYSWAKKLMDLGLVERSRSNEYHPRWRRVKRGDGAA